MSSISIKSPNAIGKFWINWPSFDAADGSGKAPPDNLEEALVRISGVDLTGIDGINTNSALKIISEIGTDISRWKTAKHFASWLGLCPGTKVSGGKPSAPRANVWSTVRRQPCVAAQSVESKAPWGRISQAAIPTGSPEGYYGHRPQTGSTGLQHAETRYRLC